MSLFGIRPTISINFILGKDLKYEIPGDVALRLLERGGMLVLLEGTGAFFTAGNEDAIIRSI